MLSAGLEDGEPRSGVRTAVVFVAYFPDDRFHDRVAATIEQVDGAYVVDNTPVDSLPFLGRGVEVIENHHNLGIATALNQGARRAVADGYDFLLMMDQDSAPREGMVAALKAVLSRWPARVAIASPDHIDPNDPPGSDRSGERGYVRSMLTTMTAGSLLDLRAYTALGPFRDDLFIDQVDHEYCLRAHRAGFDVLQVGDAVIDHVPGNRSYHHPGGGFVVTMNHPSVRRYYITRNRLMVAREYRDFPEFWQRERYRMLLELRNIILFEDQRGKKLLMTARGVWDYRRRRTGPLAGPECRGG